jgi:O-antigen ligase
MHRALRLPSITPMLSAFSCSAALFASVFFQGFETATFSLTLALLVLCLVSTLWRVPDTASSVTVSPLALAITLFWGWIGVTLLWTPVLYMSVSDFWWIGAMPMAFWSYALASDHERLWSRLFAAATVGAVGLALFATYQFLVLGSQPTSVFLNANSHAALLNLIAIPCAARYLALNVRRQEGRERILTALAFFVLVFAAALVKGRAASVTLGLGLLLVAAVAWRAVPRKALATLAALVAGAYIAAAVSWHVGSLHGGLTDRFAELQSPLQVESMKVRLQIWDATWHMIQDAPWWGVGTGMFSLLYPPYRLPQESSAGFFVHNDYLQLWYEAGVPGLLLLVIVVGSALWMFIRALRAKTLKAKQRVEMTGVFAAVAAISAHSLFDFNLHVLTILLLLGIMLARLQALAATAPGVRKRRLRLPSYLGAPIYRVVLILLAGFPMLYFGTIAFAVHETDRAQQLAKEGRLDEADQAYKRAYRYYPTADNVLVSHADLYRIVLTYTPRTQLEERREVFKRAREFLDQAEQLNPLRPLNFLVRAQLFEQNADLVGADAQYETERPYQRALAVNPRYYSGRLAYARYLQANGRGGAARALVEEGLQQYYVEGESIVPFLAFAARLRLQTGDRDGALALQQRIEQALLASGWVRVQRPEEQKPLGSATAADGDK